MLFFKYFCSRSDDSVYALIDTAIPADKVYYIQSRILHLVGLILFDDFSDK